MYVGIYKRFMSQFAAVINRFSFSYKFMFNNKRTYLFASP